MEPPVADTLNDPFAGATIDLEKLAETDIEHLRQEIRRASEPPPPPTWDETCVRCAQTIPHGTPFLPIVRNVARSHVADPNFIGRQPTHWTIEQEHAGAVCLNCLSPMTPPPATTREPG